MFRINMWNRVNILHGNVKVRFPSFLKINEDVDLFILGELFSLISVGM